MHGSQNEQWDSFENAATHSYIRSILEKSKKIIDCVRQRVCVGAGTRSWYVEYDSTGLTAIWYTNSFYTCYAINGTCWSNQGLLSSVSSDQQPITRSAGISTDYYLRLRHAAALLILGILFVAFGLIASVFLMLPSGKIKIFNGRLNILTAFLLAVAALFQRAALSEGA
ncbi:unnamed protein product, partial [Rotaria sp. Silwood1]